MRAPDLRGHALPLDGTPASFPRLVPLPNFLSSEGKYSQQMWEDTPALPKSDSAEPGAPITFSTGVPLAWARQGASLERLRLQVGGWGENSRPLPRHPCAAPTPLREIEARVEVRPKWAEERGSLALPEVPVSLNSSDPPSLPLRSLFFFSFDTKVGL